ncbi:MAG: hypothetical protein HYW07_11245 [Candidatus Latescibacteria bacterium]|nr:hypothetical protein [Candidatus Latescibacterota bacterium]
MQVLKKFPRRSWALALALLAGCGYYQIPGRFQPLQVEAQQSATAGSRMEVYDDGSVNFILNRLEVSVRPMLDEELNRQFPALSTDGKGPADELATNAFTFGEWKDPRSGQPPQRFSIFKISVKNYEYPKVKFDPLKTLIHASNGRVYYPWGRYDFEEYFRRFPQAFNGLGYQRLAERRAMVKRSQYPEDEFCFSGQTTEGYVLFPVIHSDVTEITFELPYLGIRYNFRDEAVEQVNLNFRFKRDLRKVKTYQEVAAQTAQ